MDPHFSALLDQLDNQGHLDQDLWCIDGTIARAARAAGGAGATTVIAPVWTRGWQRKWKSHRIARWATPVAALVPRFTSCATVKEPSWGC